MPQPLLRVQALLDLTWRYSAGSHFTRFFQALKDDGVILALRCPACRRVYLPPRPVGPGAPPRPFPGVPFPSLDPPTGQPRPVPFGMGLIQLDGADTTLNHYLDETDLGRLRLGLRVEAVFREPREGNMGDIRLFPGLAP